MEGLGKKLREARMARKLTLDEAGRLTRIRPGRLEEIEAEDFSQFASLAYARAFCSSMENSSTSMSPLIWRRSNHLRA